VLRGWRAPNYAGVIHQDVYGAKLGDGFLDQAGTDFWVGYIASKIKRLLAERTNFVAGLPWLRVATVAANIRPRFSQCDRDGSAKAFVRAGYQCVFAIQLE
jgi:hypothetical protein